MPKATKTIREVTLFFIIAFALMVTATGYWTLISRETLLARPDNPRALIAYNRIARGRILDRNGLILTETTGQPGNHFRSYELSAAHVVGYASFRYGLSGVEAAADSILSGTEGVSDSERWWKREVLGEPQTGNDVQLTLDRALQRAAFNALAEHSGAIVIIDPASGDILALASAPAFDPARLDSDFETFEAEANGPLINRATTALYPAGRLLALFPSQLDLSSPIDLPITTRPVVGDQVSPLHMALLTAALANNGEMPAPRLIAATCEQTSDVSIKTSEVWQCKPRPATGHPIAIIPPAAADSVRARMNYSLTLPSGFDDQTLGWFIGLSADGSRALCVLLEDSTGAEAEKAANLLLLSP